MTSMTFDWMTAALILWIALMVVSWAATCSALIDWEFLPFAVVFYPWVASVVTAWLFFDAAAIGFWVGFYVGCALLMAAALIGLLLTFTDGRKKQS